MKVIKTAKGQRQGQTMFNFLEWVNKNRSPNITANENTKRMADPFYIGDEELESLFEEFLKSI